MSTFYRAFRDHVIATPAIQAVVSGRVHAVKRPQDPVYPHLFVFRVGQPIREYSHDGDSGLVTSRFQIECVDEESSGNDAVASVLALGILLLKKPADGGFSGFKGDLGISPNELAIGAMLHIGAFDDYDPDELRIVRHVQDWRVTHACEE